MTEVGGEVNVLSIILVDLLMFLFTVLLVLQFRQVLRHVKFCLP